MIQIAKNETESCPQSQLIFWYSNNIPLMLKKLIYNFLTRAI